MALRGISGLASEQITVRGSVPASGLVLVQHVVQYPRLTYEGIPVIGNKDNGFYFPQGIVLVFFLSLAYPVMKELIHVPLSKIQLPVREKVLRGLRGCTVQKRRRSSDSPMSTRETAKHRRQGSAITHLTHTKSVVSACSRPPST